MSQRLSEQQEKRTAKALIGLANGSLVIIPAGTDTWRVRNGDQEPYLVIRTSGGWACTCPDWTERCRYINLTCKHIEAVRLAPSSSTQPPQQKETKQHMETHIDEMPAICAWLKLYHSSGALVTVPVPLGEPLSLEAAQVAFRSVTTLLEAGWLVNMPGLEEGERVEEIRHVVRRVKINEDSTETPVVDLYPDRANFRVLGIYLNTSLDVQAFEAACGVHLSALPLYEGDNAIERGKGPKTDKYVVSLPHLAKVVLKQNPRWEGDEDKKHPKRLFVRWSDVAAMAAELKAQASPSGVLPQSEQTRQTKSNNHGLNGDKDNRAMPGDDANAQLQAAREVVIPEGKTVKGKKLGEVDRKVLAYIANEYKPTTPDGEKCKKAAQLLLTAMPAATI